MEGTFDTGTELVELSERNKSLSLGDEPWQPWQGGKKKQKTKEIQQQRKAFLLAVWDSDLQHHFTFSCVLFEITFGNVFQFKLGTVVHAW